MKLMSDLPIEKKRRNEPVNAIFHAENVLNFVNISF
jgi:hypothetical protein